MNCTCLLHNGYCPIHGEHWEKEFEDNFGYILEDGMTLEDINKLRIRKKDAKYLLL